MKLLITALLALSLSGLVSCAHYGEKRCCAKKESCDLKKKDCKDKKNCDLKKKDCKDKKNCDLKKKKKK